MKLKETNWDAPGGATEVEVEYPETPIREFVNFMRRTSAWIENPEIVERKVRQLNGILMDHRNAVAAGRVPKDATPPMQRAVDIAELLADPAAVAVIERELQRQRAERAATNRKAALEKARQVKREKREAVAAQ